MDPADPKELIEEAIERAEERQEAHDAVAHAKEKRFRDRVSVLVGLFAVLLAIIHVAAAGNQRASITTNIEASDDFAYMQAKIIRETIAKTAAQNPALSATDREAFQTEAKRLRNPDKAGHGITQLQEAGEKAREESHARAERGERYEYGETALQVGIVLLSIALIARSWAIVAGAGLLAGLGLVAALGTALRWF